jgi:hypothetical protein
MASLALLIALLFLQYLWRWFSGQTVPAAAHRRQQL